MGKFQQVLPEHLREKIFSQAAEMFGPDKTDKDGETKTKEKEKESDPQKHQKIAQTNNHPNLVLIQTLAVLTLTLKWS